VVSSVFSDLIGAEREGLENKIDKALACLKIKKNAKMLGSVLKETRNA